MRDNVGEAEKIEQHEEIQVKMSVGVAGKIEQSWTSLGIRACDTCDNVGEAEEIEQLEEIQVKMSVEEAGKIE